MSVKLWLFMKMLLGASLFVGNLSEMIVKKPTEQKRAVHMKLSLRKVNFRPVERLRCAYAKKM